jgi:hypothetical protein
VHRGKWAASLSDTGQQELPDSMDLTQEYNGDILAGDQPKNKCSQLAFVETCAHLLQKWYQFIKKHEVSAASSPAGGHL